MEYVGNCLGTLCVIERDASGDRGLEGHAGGALPLGGGKGDVGGLGGSDAGGVVQAGTGTVNAAARAMAPRFPRVLGQLAGKGSKPLCLEVHLPLDLAKTWRSGKIPLTVEASVDGGRRKVWMRWRWRRWSRISWMNRMRCFCRCWKSWRGPRFTGRRS